MNVAYEATCNMGKIDNDDRGWRMRFDRGELLTPVRDI